MTERQKSSQPKQRLGDLTAQLNGIVPGSKPPIHLWNPEFCGDIAIEIRADGSWWHEGTEMRRKELVNLFASILRREEDGEYYLVTPVEKCRIKVALHPLLIIDVDHAIDDQGNDTLILALNTGGAVPLDEAHPLKLEPDANNAAYVDLDHGLSAIFSRAAWYRLVELVDENGCISSAGLKFSLIS